jgi:acyl-CoA reductase-like NAD-dependent aldehyde dehydrogenase
MRFGLLIGGEEIDAPDRETFDSIDPATGESVGSFVAANEADVDAAVAAARRAFVEEWRHVPPIERGRLLQQIGHRIVQLAEELAVDEARDSGKRLRLARADVMVAARYFEYFGNLAGTLTGEHIPLGRDVVDFTMREPYGVCAQINAWNFPLNMAARSLAAALAAGNVAVVKTPALAPLNTAVLGRIMTDVGVPSGVVNILHGSGPVVGQAFWNSAVSPRSWSSRTLTLNGRPRSWPSPSSTPTAKAATCRPSRSFIATSMTASSS